MKHHVGLSVYTLFRMVARSLFSSSFILPALVTGENSIIHLVTLLCFPYSLSRPQEQSTLCLCPKPHDSAHSSPSLFVECFFLMAVACSSFKPQAQCHLSKKVSHLPLHAFTLYLSDTKLLFYSPTTSLSLKCFSSGNVLS